jgi:hypothetical protein
MSERPSMGLHLVVDEAPAEVAPAPVAPVPADLAAAILADAELTLVPAPALAPAEVDTPVDADPIAIVDTPVDGAVDGGVDGTAPGAAVDADPSLTARPAMTLPGEEIAPWQIRYTAFISRSREFISAVKAASNQEGSAWTDSPPSLAHLAAYYSADPAPWVPRDYTGSPWVITFGRNYGRFVAIPGAAFGYSIAWVFARFYRLAVALILLGVVLLPLFI